MLVCGRSALFCFCSFSVALTPYPILVNPGKYVLNSWRPCVWSRSNTPFQHVFCIQEGHTHMAHNLYVAGSQVWVAEGYEMTVSSDRRKSLFIKWSNQFSKGNNSLNLNQMERSKQNTVTTALLADHSEQPLLKARRMKIFPCIPWVGTIRLFLASSSLKYFDFANCECTVLAGQPPGEVLHLMSFSGKPSDIPHSSDGSEDYRGFTGAWIETQHYLFEFFTPWTSCLIFAFGTR